MSQAARGMNDKLGLRDARGKPQVGMRAVGYDEQETEDLLSQDLDELPNAAKCGPVLRHPTRV